MADASRVEDLQLGDHACLTFTDQEERLDLVAAFVRDGLDGGQKVLCVTDTIPRATLYTELAGRDLPIADATASGRMSVVTSGETYLADGSFASDRMIDLLAGQIERARADGFAGLWITSDMCWALRPVTGVDQLMDFEARMTRLLSDQGATGLCQYDRQCFDTVTLTGAASNHGLALAAGTYHHDALLRVCRQYQPPGVRVSGEIDYRGVEPLTRALTEALHLDHRVHVNLAGLDFIDGSAAGAIIQAAASLRPHQTMVIWCRAHTGKIVQVLGIQELPAVTLTITDDQ